MQRQTTPCDARMTRPGRYLRRIAAAVSLLAAATLPAAGAGLTPDLAAQAVQAGGNVTQFHGTNGRTGLYVAPGLTVGAARHLYRDRGFHGTVDGKVYAQPLYRRPPHGKRALLIVVTENDVVDALDARTGALVWHRKLGEPLPAETFPCGDVRPVGITGTPVLDPKTGGLYLAAQVKTPTGPKYEIAGLDAATGRTLPGWPVRAGQALASLGKTFDVMVQGQRAALSLLDGNVYVAFGGRSGDCGDYRGIALGLAAASGRPVAAWATRGLKGGIWAPGGMAVADRRLFFATGNTADTTDWADGEAVFGLGPDLTDGEASRNHFAPGNWKYLDETDLDLSGAVPVALDLPDGAKRLVALGKDGFAYLLDRENLGGMGGELAKTRVAGGVIVTSAALVPVGNRRLLAYQAPHPVCPTGARSQPRRGIGAVAVTAESITPVWCAAVEGRGAPMATITPDGTDPIVWVVGAQGDDRLHGFDGATGAPLYTSPNRLPDVRRFTTPIVAGHRLYVAADYRVFAFTWRSR